MVWDLAAKIIAAMGMRLLTEKVVSRVFVYTGQALAKKTTNKLDDRMIAVCAEALGVALEKDDAATTPAA